MYRAIVFVQCTWTKVRGFGHLSDKVCFSNPRPLDMREDNGNDMTGILESFDKGVDVWRGLI